MLLALTLLAACSSDKKDDDPTPDTSVAGVSWSVDGATITDAKAQGQISGNTFGFAANFISGTGTINGLTFSNVPRTAGTYDLSGTSSPTVTGAMGYYILDATVYAATSGSLVVTSVGTSNAVGTFSFTGTKVNGTPTKTITSGKFNVSY